MKRILLSSLSIVALAVLGTGCLKDKDYDNNVYGGSSQIGSNAAVSFPAAAAGEVITYGLVSQAAPYNLVGPHIALEGTGPLSSDVHVNIAVQDALVDTANVHNALPTGNGIVLTILDPSEYSLDLNRTIVAGHPFDSVVVTFNNLTDLDPNITYAIGLSITSVDNGLQVISVEKNIVLQINIRNPFDGIYSVESGHVQRYTTPGTPEVGPLNGDLLGNPDVYLVTTGPFDLTIPPSPGPGQLFWAAGSNSSVAGIDPLDIHVDGSNNVTVTSGLLANLANWTGHINTYDLGTQTFHLSFNWTNTAGSPREYEIVLKYVGPRP